MVCQLSNTERSTKRRGEKKLEKEINNNKRLIPQQIYIINASTYNYGFINYDVSVYLLMEMEEPYQDLKSTPSDNTEASKHLRMGKPAPKPKLKFSCTSR